MNNEERKKFFNDNKGNIYINEKGEKVQIIGAEFKNKLTNRYLLFDISHTEQFFKQIRGLYYYLDFAKQINYTLVLPKMRFLKKDNNNNIIDPRIHEYVSFDEYFNIHDLNEENYKTITIEEFEKLNIPIDYIYFENTEFFTDNNELYTQKEISLLDDNKVLFSDIALKYKNFIHKDMNKVDFRSMFINSVLAFKGVFFQPTNVEPFHVINILNFKYKYYDYVIKLIRNQNIDKYIAIHYRQSDFLKKRINRSDVLKDVDYLIKTCKEYMKQYDISNVYIATDSKDENILIKLRNNLPLFFIQEYDNELTNEQNLHVIESCICINSNVFIGTNSSCYSTFITSKRKCNNNTLNFYL
tara:strand:+ start:718 stop:1785 length:1068 start_codon:yes stop_codon:yes gene_type:complete